MIPFEMIVLDKLRDRASEVSLPQRNDSIQTLFLDRPDESLGVGIRVRSALRCQNHSDAGLAKPLSHRTAPLPIPIADQYTIPISTLSSAVARRTIWPMNTALGWGVEPRMSTRREARSRTNTV